ncbi:MAG: ribonuclease Y [Patescibacteria group bacterium]|nr:ribonuclease Y [Patescibacteria group bacterium]MDE2591158.1 ribonuclease Y [Patescibacteria group bacterium]
MADTVLDLEKKLLEKQEKLEEEKEKVEKVKDEYKEKLEKLSGMTASEAKEKLLEEVTHHETAAVARIIRESEEEAKATANQKVKEILADAMRHGATNYVAEYTVSVIPVESEEMKGRIIGKEGRNIRAFEMATGVDVMLDEEGIIRLSSFDQVRREIARRSLEKLLKDTRIQPFRIEEVVKQTQQEVDRIMLEEGQKLAQQVGVFNIPVDLLRTLGRFKFRTSYGQSLVLHSLEVTKVAVALASEVGADVNIVRLGALFHDIGKVVEGEGSHVKLGVELLKKFNFPEAVINCVAEHHEDKPFSSVESILVHIGDAISAARPGARYEDIENYGKRLTEMEQMAKRHEGVEDAYAFEAGRELRVIVIPEKIDDAQAVILANQLREQISTSLAIPGEVRVTVIREFRAIAGETLAA